MTRRAMLSWAVAIIGFCVIAALVALVYGVVASVTSSPATPASVSSTSASQPASGELVTAQHASCAQLGAAVLQYLRTGDSSGDRRLDIYAEERAQIMLEAVDAQPGLMRHAADDAIGVCDRELDAREASAAASARAAADSATSAAAASADAARYRSTCSQHNGHMDGEQCQPSLRGYFMNFMPITPDGSWDVDDAARAKANCRDYGSGYVWHEREGVCVAV